MKNRLARLVAPGRVVIEERESPRPAHGQVLIRVVECGLCTSEVDRYRGLAAIGEEDQMLGHEIAGRVEAVGAGVASRAGDPITAWVPGGGMADYVLAEERHCVPVPAGLPYAAVAEPLACSVATLEMAPPRFGDHVAIVGYGFMGRLLLQLLRMTGAASVTVAGRRSDVLEDARRDGASHVVDLAQEPLREAIQRLTGRSGADVVYEAVGTQEALDQAADATGERARLVIVGYHQEPRMMPLGDLARRAVQIHNAHFAGDIVDAMRTGIRLMRTGRIDPSGLVTNRFPVSEVAAAFELAARRPIGFVKAVITTAT